MIHYSYLPANGEEIPPRFWFKGKAPTSREMLAHNALWLVLLAVVITRGLGFLP